MKIWLIEFDGLFDYRITAPNIKAAIATAERCALRDAKAEKLDPKDLRITKVEFMFETDN